ncbi:MAG: DUF6338 family protein [Pseudonocardiaceae bacterium]
MPTTVLGVLLFVVLLAPGFAHALVKERRSPRQVFSAFRETVSLVLVSIVADMVCLLLFFLVQAIAPDILDVTAFLRDPGGYAAVHYVRLTLLTVVLLGIATTGAAVAAAKPVRRPPGRGRAPGLSLGVVAAVHGQSRQPDPRRLSARRRLVCGGHAAFVQPGG